MLVWPHRIAVRYQGAAAPFCVFPAPAAAAAALSSRKVRLVSILCLFTPNVLEDVFQCKLKLARVVRLARDSAKGAARRIHNRNAPVWMIQNVEHLEAKLKRLSLIDPKILS